MGRILVTGGAKGMGAAVVRAAVAGGHDVLFTYRGSGTAAERLVAELAAAHPEREVSARQLDLADKGAVDAFAAELAAGPAFYGFVHVAGATYDMLAAIMDQAQAEAVMQVNFHAATRLVGAIVREMSRSRAGRIVMVGSVAAAQASVGNAAYAASKAALAAYVRNLAVETARRGVTVNTVAPGFVDTDMLAPYAAHRAAMEKQIPAGRFGRAEEVAALVGFLLSPAATYLTGTVLPVDGGLSAAIAVHR